MKEFILETIANLFGVKKSYHSIGKVFLMNRGLIKNPVSNEEEQATLIGGLLIGDLRKELDNSEMWEGEIVFIPRKIHRDTKKNPLFLGDLCMILTQGYWTKPKQYGETEDNVV